jgi:cytochrome bd-type quinol oxidase subunit 2
MITMMLLLMALFVSCGAIVTLVMGYKRRATKDRHFSGTLEWFCYFSILCSATVPVTYWGVFTPEEQEQVRALAIPNEASEEMAQDAMTAIIIVGAVSIIVVMIGCVGMLNYLLLKNGRQTSNTSSQTTPQLIPQQPFVVYSQGQAPQEQQTSYRQPQGRRRTR